jgi:hypothetical protein
MLPGPGRGYTVGTYKWISYHIERKKRKKYFCSKRCIYKVDRLIVIREVWLSPLSRIQIHWTIMKKPGTEESR